jgi:hypothetical protein
MVQGLRHEVLMDLMIPARRHVNILVIPRLLLVQSSHYEQVDCTREVLSLGAIVRRQDHLQIDWLGEVIAEDLLPVT